MEGRRGGGGGLYSTSGHVSCVFSILNENIILDEKLLDRSENSKKGRREILFYRIKFKVYYPGFHVNYS